MSAANEGKGETSKVEVQTAKGKGQSSKVKGKGKVKTYKPVTDAVAGMMGVYAQKIEGYAQLIRVQEEGKLPHAKAAGKELAAAKAAYGPYGEWMKWVAKNTTLSHSTANDYMRISSDTYAKVVAKAKTIEDAVKAIRAHRAANRKPGDEEDGRTKGAKWPAVLKGLETCVDAAEYWAKENGIAGIGGKKVLMILMCPGVLDKADKVKELLKDYMRPVKATKPKQRRDKATRPADAPEKAAPRTRQAKRLKANTETPQAVAV